jgi:hypothetical protein
MRPNAYGGRANLRSSKCATHARESSVELNAFDPPTRKYLSTKRPSRAFNGPPQLAQTSCPSCGVGGAIGWLGARYSHGYRPPEITNPGAYVPRSTGPSAQHAPLPSVLPVSIEIADSVQPQRSSELEWEREKAACRERLRAESPLRFHLRHLLFYFLDSHFSRQSHGSPGLASWRTRSATSGAQRLT